MIGMLLAPFALLATRLLSWVLTNPREAVEIAEKGHIAMEEIGL